MSDIRSKRAALSVRRLQQSIDRWESECDNHRETCTSSVWGSGASWDCQPAHQEYLDCLEWGGKVDLDGEYIEGILDYALALEGEPLSDAPEHIKAAYGYRDANKAWDAIDKAHKDHHRVYRMQRNYKYPDLGECDKCDETLDLWEDEHQQLIEKARNEFGH